MKLFIVFMLMLFCTSTTATTKAVSDPIDLMIVMKQRNMDLLESIVNKVSNPFSQNYGNYMTIDQINRLVSPNLNEQYIVHKWLLSHGISSENITSYGDMLYVSTEKHLAEKLLGVSLTRLPYSRMNESPMRYSIPSYLKGLVEFVGMIYNSNKPSLKLPMSEHSAPPADPGYVGREVGCRLYNMNCDYQVVNGVSAGAIEYQDNPGFSQSDLHDSQGNNSIVYRRVSKGNIVGPNMGTDLETQLDMQMISQTAANVDLWMWDSAGWLYEFAVSFFNTKDVPDVISMSWGWAEAGQCEIIQCGRNMTSEDYVNRVNREYLKIAARGVTICASSGDAGAPGRTEEGCGTQSPVNPVLPTSSPWVTSVGATYVVKGESPVNWTTPVCQQYGCATGTEERTTNFAETSWTAGGGFSIYDIETRPWWQEGAAVSYLNSGTPMPNSFNRQGRAYPDVTVYGHNCPTWEDGMMMPIDGTSCSSPVFAGIVALLNDHQLSQGKPKLGYLNPLLYLMWEDDPSTFNDITTGNNWCTEGKCCPVRKDGGSDFGFHGAKGYDAVTGLGTPNVTRIIEWLDRNT
jgi:subtilase family serine protease